MNEPFHIEHAGEPVALTFGSPKGDHIIATLRPAGYLSVQRYTDFDHDDDSSWPISGHEIIEENWTEHPEEAPATYELRDGDRAVASFSFPSLNEPCSPDAEAQNEAYWRAVWQFADEHKIDIMYVGKAFSRHILHAHLDREAVISRRLVRPAPEKPAPPRIAHEMSA